MKDRIFGVLQRVGRSFMLPIAILPVAGLLLGIGSSFTNQTTIATYGLQRILGEGTFLHALLVIMSEVGSAVFDNLPIIFAVGVAIGMAKKEKEVAALAALIAFFVMHISISAMLLIHGDLSAANEISDTVLEGTIAFACGIPTLQMGVFGGILVGLGVAVLHNRFYKIALPNALSFFGGSRFVPIISTLIYMLVGIALYYVWPPVQNGIYALGSVVTGTGYFGTLLFGLIKRALIPFGLHHVFYMPFWQTGVGGSMEVAGKLVQGGQNIFFAQLADSANIAHFSADATRYFSGEFIFMIFGLPGAALAMYQCARPEKKKTVGGLLLSASLASMLTGITEPLEFSFLFVAPVLFVVQVILAGFAYMIAHMLNIAVGLTFSGGLLDLFLFGVLQGNEKTDWLKIIPVGILYFFLYYFIFKFLIKKWNLKTPGRESDEEDTKLYTKADVNAAKGSNKNRNTVAGRENTTAAGGENAAAVDPVSAMIVNGLGGKENISDVDCCATRLRCTVNDSTKVDEKILKNSGTSGVIKKGKGVQIIYGPRVTVIKSNLEEYLENPSSQNVLPENPSAQNPSSKNALPENPSAQSLSTQKDLPQNSSTLIIIASPMTGVAADLTKAPDDGFAQKMMGDGATVTPTDPLVVAPADGTVSFVFETKHGLGFLTDSGLELLLHIGIDTVKLQGKGFEVLVKPGEEVKKGQPLMKLDLEYLRENAFSMVSPILCTNLEEGQEIIRLSEGEVKAGEPLFEVKDR
ncbi:MAG: glucose PTS transporter subunit IIA [Lachnospiraceae bacterium]